MRYELGSNLYQLLGGGVRATPLQRFAYQCSRWLRYGPIVLLAVSYLLLQLDLLPITMPFIWVPWVLNGLLLLIAFPPFSAHDVLSQKLLWLVGWVYPLAFIYATLKREHLEEGYLGVVLLGWGGYFLLMRYLGGKPEYTGAMLGVLPGTTHFDGDVDDDYDDDDDDDDGLDGGDAPEDIPAGVPPPRSI
jgi:hypothetical protein